MCDNHLVKKRYVDYGYNSMKMGDEIVAISKWKFNAIDIITVSTKKLF